MAYLLLNRNQSGVKDIIRSYQTYKGALIGMCASNRNAGWVKSSRCHSGLWVMEWSRSATGEYDYAPYVIMHEFDYRQKFQSKPQECLTA